MTGPVPAVVTGEAVQLDLRLAALPSRAAARLIDLSAQILVYSALGALVVVVSTATSDAAAAALAIVALVLVLVVYPVAFETLQRGRTPGKAALGLRVVRDDGGPIGFRQALVRGLTSAFLDLPSFGATAVVPSLLDRRNKRLGDFLAGTVVLQERVAAVGGPVAVVPPALIPWAQTLDLSGLPEELALSARQFSARASTLTDAAREDLGGRLVQAVLAMVTPAPPPGTPGWAVLAAVLAERRRREEQRLAARPVADDRPSIDPGPPTDEPPRPAPPGAFTVPS